MTDGRLLAIGNFDGVHVGHQHLLRAVLSAASAKGFLPTVLTFDPHPAVVVGRSAPPLLTAHWRKMDLLRALDPGLEVLVLKFDEALSHLSPRQFVERVLVGQYGAREVIVGENFRFGFRRAGDLTSLQEIGAEFGLLASAFPLLSLGATVVSSTRIRQLIAEGDVLEAAGLLGRPHQLNAEVVKGAQLGRRLGFPTANLGSVSELLPLSGVYACRAAVDGEPGAAMHPAVANVGFRPTVGGTRTTVEAHLLDFDGDIYGRRIRLDLCSRLRDERKFEDLAALRAQIALDVELARYRLTHPG